MCYLLQFDPHSDPLGQAVVPPLTDEETGAQGLNGSPKVKCLPSPCGLHCLHFPVARLARLFATASLPFHPRSLRLVLGACHPIGVHQMFLDGQLVPLSA